MDEVFRFLFGIVAIFCFSFAAVGLLLLMLRMATPGVAEDPSLVGRTARALSRLFSLFGARRTEEPWPEDKQAAMQYLIGELAAEAERQSIPFTDRELEILNYCQNAAPERAAAWERFVRSGERERLEIKVFVLERKILANRCEQDEWAHAKWNLAAELLDDGGYYLQTLLPLSPAPPTAPRRRLRSWLIRAAIALLLAAIVVLANLVLRRL